MVNQLKQFVPQNVCLSCDGCCRFKEADSQWRPHYPVEEIRGKIQKPLADLIFSKEQRDDSGFIKTVLCEGQHLCSFFDLSHNTCRIYSHRPFECQLYPFVLAIQEGKTALLVHLNCPFIHEKRSTKEFDQYVDYLKEYFSQTSVLDFIQRNPQVVGDYSAYREELEFLFILR